MKDKKLIPLLFSGLIIVILATITAYEKFLKPEFTVPEGKVLVEETWLDSLQIMITELQEGIMEKDSIIITDTITLSDTVRVPIKEPVYVDDSTNYYSQTFKTRYFDFHLRDTIQGNTITWREYNYTAYIPERTIRIISIAQVPFIYRTPDRHTLSAGINIGTFNSIDLSFSPSASQYSYGIGFGYFGTKRMYYARFSTPIISW